MKIGFCTSILILGLFSTLSTPATAQVFTVNTTVDADDGVCNSDHCSLREAMQAANAAPGAVLVTVAFALTTIDANYDADAGLWTLTPDTPLPEITRDSLAIDGTTQVGASCGQLIEGNPHTLTVVFDGRALGNEDGLHISSNNVQVRGLVMRDFERSSIRTFGEQTHIACSYLGTNHTGDEAAGSNDGLVIKGDAALIENNLISGNGSRQGGSGIMLHETTGTRVQGNLIGTNSAGTSVIQNGYGVLLTSTTENIIGGPESQHRNVISGSRIMGVFISGLSTRHNVVQSNYIGTDITGTRRLGNPLGVVLSDAVSNTIGGIGAGNVIAASSNAGIFLNFASTTNNVIQGNFIGTDASGTAPLHNKIGVHVSQGASGNTIGGTQEGQGNRIAFNTLQGVWVEDGTRIRIRGNSLFSNGRLGIDLDGGDEDAAGVSANDSTDADSGPNLLINFPSLADGVFHEGTGELVLGYTITTAPSSSKYPLQVEFFLADDEGEGHILLGIDTYTASDYDSTGFKEITFVPTMALTEADSIVATVTDDWGNTSEFSMYAAGVTVEPVVDDSDDDDSDDSGTAIDEIPTTTYQLSAAFPNPFTSHTQLILSVEQHQQVRLEVYDLLGRRVAVLHEGALGSGTAHHFLFEAKGLPSGLYLVHATGETFRDERKVVLRR